MSDFYIPPLPDDFVENVMEQIARERAKRNKQVHQKACKQRKK